MDDNGILKDKNLHAIFGITLIAVMGVASIAPALPKMSVVLNLNKTQVGLLISAFTFPGIFLAPVAGIMADRIGRKTVLVPSLFLFAVAGFAIFYVHGFKYILLFRIIQGVGAAPLGSLNATLIGDYFKGRQLPQAMGYNASVLSMSTATYPLVGGLLAGVSWYYPFLLPLIAIPVGLFVIFNVKEPIIQRPSSLRQYFIDISASILRKEVIAIFILGTLTFIILYGAFITYLPFLLNQKFELSSAKIGLFISLSSFTTAIVSTQIGRLTWKYGSVSLLRMAFFLYLLVNILMPNINDIYVILAPILFFGAAQALNIPSLQTMLAKLAPDNQRGTFMSLNGTIIRLGQTLGPIIIGIGYAIRGLEGAYYLGASMALLGLIIVLIMLRQKTV